MNFSQRLGLIILIIISVTYAWFSFFNKGISNRKHFEHIVETPVYNPMENNNENIETEKPEQKKNNVNIFLVDKNGSLRSVERTCDPTLVDSCFKFAINELVTAPNKLEKSKGYTSEIPQGTKVISVRESNNSVMIDLSPSFETGGGAESTYTRIKQIIKTANANTTRPTYLYINGRQANVIGGEGIMIKQPLNERSFDE